jgi:hypothetical protein
MSSQKGLQNIHGLCKHIGELNFGLSVKQRHGYKTFKASNQYKAQGSPKISIYLKHKLTTRLAQNKC